MRTPVIITPRPPRTPVIFARPTTRSDYEIFMVLRALGLTRLDATGSGFDAEEMEQYLDAVKQLWQASEGVAVGCEELEDDFSTNWATLVQEAKWFLLEYGSEEPRWAGKHLQGAPS